MKLKGINPLEQHVEKIVLGVFVVAALGMVAFQFLRDSSVKVNNKQVPIAAAYDEAIREAERLQGRIRSADLPPKIPETVPDLVAAIRGRIDDPVAPTAPLAASLGFLSPGLDGEILEGPTQTAEHAPLEPPAPLGPIARAFAGALDPILVASDPAVRAIAPAQQPYDVAAVSVQATFPASELVRRLDADPDGDGPLEAYPKFLWINRLAILDIQLERQELLPSGEYTPPMLVDPAPGIQQAARKALAGEPPTSAVYRSIVAAAREDRANIVRPRFLPIIAGEAWSPPSAQPVALAAPGAASDPGELQRLRSVLEDKKRDLQQIEAELAKPAATSALPKAPSTVAGGPRAQSINPGGGGPSRDRGPTPEERRREALTQRRDRVRSDIQQIEASIAAMGGAPTTGAQPQSDLLTQPIPMLDTGEDHAVWAHDLTAEPGASYRYRMRVLISNPLFGDRAFPDAPPVVVGAFSEWTAPIEVAPRTMVFFTSAQSGIGGQTGSQNAGASAEVYHFFYGYWRRANVRLNPGDAIAARVNAPQMPLFAVTGSTAQQDGSTPTEIPVAMDAFLVDVVETATEAGFGQRKTRWHVVFRDEDGRLVSRLPEEDRASPARLRAEAAAAAGVSGQVRAPGTPDPSGQPTPTARPQGAPPPAATPGGPARPAGPAPGGRVD